MSDGLLYATFGVLCLRATRPQPDVWDEAFFGIMGVGFWVAAIVEWFA